MIRNRHNVVATPSRSPTLTEKKGRMNHEGSAVPSKSPNQEKKNLQDRVSRVAISKEEDDEIEFMHNFKEVF